MSKRKGTGESGVLRACLDLLAYEKIFHIRMNVGAVKDGKRFFRFGRPGMADILAIINLSIQGPAGDYKENFRIATYQRPQIFSYAHPLWIECKAEKGKQTIEQEEFEKEVSERNHTYLLVRDVDTLRQFLKEHGCL